MLLLIAVILSVAIFCFIKGYIFVGIICLAGFSGKIGWLALVVTSVYLLSKGNYIIGILPLALIAWNLYGLKFSDQEEPWILLVKKSFNFGKKGDYQASIKSAKKALELNPNAAEAWRLIGNAYELMADELDGAGDILESAINRRKATEAWNKAKEIDPNIIIPAYHE